MASGPTPTPNPPDPNPNPNPNPNASPNPKPKLPIKRRFSSLLLLSSPSSSSSAAAAAAADPPAPPAPAPAPSPPVKIQRVWSESDELRFLQGLLGSRGQGLVFPRDLNVFYDRFSESMPQPFTRNQLSEKLRRLRNKHRAASARISSGADGPPLSSHDKDVLHLCDRLWDPAFAATSPFRASPAGEASNKRRRASQGSSGHVGSNADDNGDPVDNNLGVNGACEENGSGSGNGDVNGFKKDNKRAMADAVLDLFDECVKEVCAEGAFDVVHRDGGFVERWKAQQMAELGVLSKRLRLVISDAAGW